MKVLFVSSGKSGSISEIVKNQGESLKTAGIDVDYFIIKPGFSGYLLSVPKIRRTLRHKKYDLVHAHYSLSGFAAALAGCKPLVVSLMGSDVFMSVWLRILTRCFYYWKWDATIVKTKEMKELIKLKRAHIIPNGVNINRFKPMPKAGARKHLNYPQDKKLILFISIPDRPEKNSGLAEKAVELLKGKEIELMKISNVPNSEIPYYLNAADILLLTSKWEGSVNVVKEAMACNCPVVSTNVGDVEWITGKTGSCFITSFDPEDVANRIKTVLSDGKRTNGRLRIVELGLDSVSIATRILILYKEALK